MGDIKYNLRTPSDMYWGAYKVKVAFYGDIHLYPHIEVYDAIATYNVTSTTSNTKIFGSLDAIEKMYIDEVERTPNTIFKFKTTGEHIIKIVFKENATSFSRLFDSCESLTRFELFDYSTSNISDFSHSFVNCNNLEYVSELDCTNAEDLSYIFNNCKLQTLPIVNVTNKCKYLIQTLSLLPLITEIDVSAWDVSSVESMLGLFAYSDKLQKINISNWTIQTNTNTESMFEHTPALSLVMCNNVTCDTKGLIEQQLETDGHTNVTITSNVNCGGGEFDPSLYDIILHFDESRVSSSNPFGIKVNGVEYTATTSPLALTYADVGVSNVDEITSYNIGGIGIHSTSYLTKVEKLPIGKGVSSVENLFNNCQILTEINADNWDLSNVLNANFMFGYCYELTSIKKNGAPLTSLTIYPTYAWGMFGVCQKLTLIPSVNIDNLKDARYMFYDCQTVENITLDGQFNFIETTECMFKQCYSLKNIDVSPYNVGANLDWTNAQEMFNGCHSLQTDPLNNSYMKTNRLTSVVGMYKDCRSLTEISFFNQSYWGFTDLQYIASCFDGCSNLNSIYLGHLSYASQQITNLYNLFKGCTRLSNIDFSDWQLQNVDTYDGMFDGCWNLFEINLNNANCTTLDVITNAWNNTGYGYDNIVNAPSCGGGNAQGSNRFILQAAPYNMGYISYNDGYSTSFNENNEEYFVFNDTIENFEDSYGEISALSFDTGIENIISIPYIDTLTSLTINNLNIKYLDLSMTNLNNLEYLNISNLPYIVHLDFSNWQTVSDNLRYNYQYVWESLDNLRTIKMLNCSQDAKDFVNQMLQGVFMYDVIVITEDNNNYITTYSDSSQSDANFADSTQPLYSPVTDINDWGYSNFDNMGVQNLFQNNISIQGVYNLPSLSATTGHWNMFNGCENLQYLDCSNYDFDWVNNDQDIASMFANCYNIAWLNLSSWDLASAYNYTEMFNSCANLRWIFAYNCNDDTINKINEALQYGYDNGWINNTVEVYCDQNGN